jgi:hypothetical protein
MKNLFLTISCCILLFSAAPAQPAKEKSSLFNEIKTLRIQYKFDEFYLNSSENFGEGSKYKNDRKKLVQAKAKIDALDKEYSKLLSPAELIEYTEWKRKEDLKDKMQDLRWWYPAFTRNGC